MKKVKLSVDRCLLFLMNCDFMTQKCVINHLLNIHWICDVLGSDNRPQYCLDLFKTFAKEYTVSFKYITNSPTNPHANRKAEQAVRTVKKFLIRKKAAYLYLAGQHHCL